MSPATRQGRPDESRSFRRRAPAERSAGMLIQFRDFSLTRKMVVALLVSVVPGLLLAFVSFVLLGMFQQRNNTIDRLRALTETIAIHSARALASGDAKAASEAMYPLRLNKLITDAEIR